MTNEVTIYTKFEELSLYERNAVSAITEVYAKMQDFAFALNYIRIVEDIQIGDTTVEIDEAVQVARDLTDDQYNFMYKQFDGLR